jgi:hypothetical protein
MGTSMPDYRAIILGYIWQPDIPICSTERTIVAETDEDAIRQAFEESRDFREVVDCHVTEITHEDSMIGTTEVHSTIVRAVHDWEHPDHEEDYFATTWQPKENP